MNFTCKRKISVDMFIFKAAVCQQNSFVKCLVRKNVLVRTVYNRKGASRFTTFACMSVPT